MSDNIIVTYGGPQGPGGDNAYLYIAWASDDSGADFTTTFNAALNYVAFKNSSTVIAAPQASDFTGLWKNYKGATGANGSLAWQDDWASDHGTYYVNDFVYHAVTGYGKGLFRCMVEHDPSVAATEPVVGGSAATYWETSIGGGADGEGTGDMLADGTVAMTGALTMTQISTPSEPAASKTAIYAKSDGKVYKYANGGAETEIGSGAGFWSDMPGSPTRVSDTSFTITDTSNANVYDKAFGPGTVLKWEKSGGGVQFAKITGASYGTNTVTITIVGNTLAAAFTDMKYCIHRAEQEVFIVPGTLPGNTATTDIAKTRHIRGDIYVFSAKIWYKTAPTTTKGVWDINDDGTTIFTTKPEVAASATEGVEQVSDCLAGTALTAVADKSLITVDYDSGHATTPGSDAYVYLFWMPVAWRYLS